MKASARAAGRAWPRKVAERREKGTVRIGTVTKVPQFSQSGALWRGPHWEKWDVWDGRFVPWICRKMGRRVEKVPVYTVLDCVVSQAETADELHSRDEREQYTEKHKKRSRTVFGIDRG